MYQQQKVWECKAIHSVIHLCIATEKNNGPNIGVLIPEGPLGVLLWWETTWTTTDHWWQLLGACFWEMSLLDRKIFQRHQDVNNLKEDTFMSDCVKCFWHIRKIPLLQVKDLFQMICRYHCDDICKSFDHLVQNLHLK